MPAPSPTLAQPTCLFCRTPLTVEPYHADVLNREHPRWVAECTACGVSFLGDTEADALSRWQRGERLPPEIARLAKEWVGADLNSMAYRGSIMSVWRSLLNATSLAMNKLLAALRRAIGAKGVR
jgi:hypothetical protein